MIRSALLVLGISVIFCLACERHGNLSQDLQVGATIGDAKSIKDALARGDNVNGADENGNSVLRYVFIMTTSYGEETAEQKASRGLYITKARETIPILIQAGANVNARNDNSSPPDGRRNGQAVANLWC
jgi:hypothetical protein